MSGVSRRSSATEVRYVRAGKDLGMVDPTVEITQPGGPFPYGEAILTDGGGGYTIAPTLRPYLFDLKIPSIVEQGGSVDCESDGIATSSVGLLLPLTANLIAIMVAVDAPVRPNASYTIEVVQDSVASPVVIASLVLTSSDGRKTFRRDLSVEVKVGVEVGARIVQTSGDYPSTFSKGRVRLELES